MSLLHHMAATQAMEIGFTVILVDGSSYRATRGDHVFIDGLWRTPINRYHIRRPRSNLRIPQV